MEAMPVKVARARAASTLSDYITIQHDQADQDIVVSSANILTDERLSRYQFIMYLLTELRILMITAIPVVFLACLDQCMASVTALFCGHLGKAELSAASLSATASKLICQMAAFAVIGVSLTHISQSSRSENPKQVGVYMQTALLLLTVVFTITWSLLFNIYYVFSAFGQNEEVSILSGRFIVIYTIGDGGRQLYILFSRYLFCQNKMLPSVLICIFSNVLNGGLQYVMTYYDHLDIRAAAIGYTVSYYVNVSLHVIYIYLSGIYIKNWSGFSRKSLLDWGRFFRLSLTSIVMVGMEIWMFEIGMILAGLIGVTQLAASSVLLQLWPIFCSSASGMRDGAAVRVGIYLGERASRSAKIVSRLAMGVAGIVGLLTAVLIFVLRTELPKVFSHTSSDLEVLNLAANLMYILGIITAITPFKRTMDGIFVGCGKQSYGGLMAFLGYVIFTCPLVLILKFFTSAGVYSFWSGMTAGLLGGALLELSVICRIDWSKEVEKAQLRAKVQRERQPSQALDNSEKAGLLTGRKRQNTDADVYLSNKQWQWLYLKRGALLSISGLIFIFAILARFTFLDLPELLPNTTDTNTTMFMHIANTTGYVS